MREIEASFAPPLLLRDDALPHSKQKWASAAVERGEEVPELHRVRPGDHSISRGVVRGLSRLRLCSSRRVREQRAVYALQPAARGRRRVDRRTRVEREHARAVRHVGAREQPALPGQHSTDHTRTDGGTPRSRRRVVQSGKRTICAAAAFVVKEPARTDT